MNFCAAAMLSLVLGAVPPLTAARAQTLCFSDAELMSLLIEIHMNSLGKLSGSCVARFPDMFTGVATLGKQLGNTYRTELAANDRLSLQAFERAYPGRGREMRDQHADLASESSLKAAAKFTRHECENIQSALEATVVANDWKLVTLPARAFFDLERARTPACR